MKPDPIIVGQKETNFVSFMIIRTLPLTKIGNNREDIVTMVSSATKQCNGATKNKEETLIVSLRPLPTSRCT